MKTKIDLYQQVTDQVLELMQDHGANWVRPWATGDQFNPQTGTHYRGINVLLLGLAKHKNGFASNAWSTFKGWQAKGGQINKGSKATWIIFYKTITRTTKNEDGIEEDDSFPVMRSYAVFNLDQVTGVALPEPKESTGCFLDSVDSYVLNTGAEIAYGGDTACYIPSLDKINMPTLASFHDIKTSTAAESYYSTLFHELTHWSGAAKRLNRVKGSAFASESYAFEELIAELGAAFQCASHGIAPEPRVDHAKYLNGWIKALTENKKVIFKASSAAQKAVDYCNELQDQEISEAA